MRHVKNKYRKESKIMKNGAKDGDEEAEEEIDEEQE